MNAPTPMLPVSGVRLCLALVALGWVAMAVGWYEAAGRVRVEDQLSWTVVSVGGVTAVGLATVTLVLAARRSVEERLRFVLTAVEEDEQPAAWGVTAPGAGALVAADGMARYHLASCRLAKGKPVRRMDRRGHEAAGRRPCGVCLRGISAATEDQA
jgi:hypothetical protein